MKRKRFINKRQSKWIWLETVFLWTLIRKETTKRKANEWNDCDVNEMMNGWWIDICSMKFVLHYIYYYGNFDAVLSVVLFIFIAYENCLTFQVSGYTYIIIYFKCIYI